MADATNEMTMNAQGHWPAMLRMASAWSQMRGAHTADAMVHLLRSNVMAAAAIPGDVAKCSSTPAGEAVSAGAVLR